MSSFPGNVVGGFRKTADAMVLAICGSWGRDGELRRLLRVLGMSHGGASDSCVPPLERGLALSLCFVKIHVLVLRL